MKTRAFSWLIFFFAFVFGSNAQQCCKVTAEFADLGKNADFMMAHMEPQSRNLDPSGKWIEMATAGEKAGRGYLTGAGEESSQWLFVFHEWWGLNDHIVAEADRWAKELPGVRVLAIDLYDGASASTREAAAKLMAEADEDRIREIIGGAIKYAGDEASVATIGWCFGGGWSMQAAIMLEDQSPACVIYYGMPEKSKEKIKLLKAPVLGIFAEEDQWINREVVSEYEAVMERSGKKYDSVWYDADHAFANPSNPHFDGESAKAARNEALTFLSKHLIK